MAKFIIAHKNLPRYITSYHLDLGCKICQQEKRVSWQRCYYNFDEGRIFCEWEAPDKETLKRILSELGLPCEDITEVDTITPQECHWDLHGLID